MCVGQQTQQNLWLSFCFHDLSIAESGVLKSPIIIVWGEMCSLSFTKVSLMNVDALEFGA